MKKIAYIFLNSVQRFIDFFYRPFRRFVSLQFFRYGVVGSINLVFDWILYYVVYNFVLEQNMLVLGFVTISSHIAALGVKFPIITFFAFVMQKFITFSSSEIRGQTQLFRYFMVVIVNLSVSYLGLKVFVDFWGINPTLSYIILTPLNVLISYLSQKHYTFKTVKLDNR